MATLSKDDKVTCPRCNGSKGSTGKCINCQGSGVRPDLLHGGTVKCQTCNGAGKKWNPCTRCSGTGWIYPGETAPGDTPQGDQGDHHPDGSEPGPQE